MGIFEKSHFGQKLQNLPFWAKMPKGRFRIFLAIPSLVITYLLVTYLLVVLRRFLWLAGHVARLLYCVAPEMS